MEHFKRYKFACSQVQLSEGEGGGGGGRSTNSSRLRLIEEAFFVAETRDNPWKAVCTIPEARMGNAHFIIVFVVVVIVYMPSTYMKIC